MQDKQHPEYDTHYNEWKRTLPNASHEVIHAKVVAHLAFKDQIRSVAEKPKATIPCQFFPSKCDYVPPAPVRLPWELRAIVAILAAILAVLILGIATKAAPEPPLPLPFNHVMMLPQAGSVPIPLPIEGSGSSSPVYVICSSGCSPAGAFSDNSAFTVGTTPGSILFGYYTSGSDPTLSTGNAARARIDAHSYLLTDCAVGCSGGTFNNNADAVATSATNGQSAAWLYGFNGTTFDRLRVDGSKNLEVNINASSATVPVSGTFWQATQPVSGTFWQTTQPVSGTFFQATQPVSLAAAQVASGAYAAGSIADGAEVTIGAKADAKSAATDTTPITAMQVLKEISSLEQAPASRPVTNAGTFAVQDATVEGAITGSKMQTNTVQVGGTAVVANPCQQAVPTVVPISQTASTKVISATSAKHNYICSIMLIAGAAEIPSIVEGTGTVCATSTAAVVGSTTTANGMSLAANGGFSLGNGGAAVIPGIGTNVDTCLFQNGSNRLSGFLSYVQE